MRAPQGTTLMHLPGSRGLGLDPRGRLGDLPGMAVAAVLPVGFLRLLLPAYRPEPQGDQRTLPLYGYTAVAESDGQLLVAALTSDKYSPWTGHRPSPAQIQRSVTRLQRRLPRSRVVAQLSICAVKHNCLTAQNTFLGRFEGALPTSAACNADCLGCISLQTDSGAPAPQPRLPRAPTGAELLEVAGLHLQAARRRGEPGMVSFGQGCEGEPLLRERALRPVVAELRRSFPEATLHINTNGSRPAALGRLFESGLNSCRISVFSFRQELFAAYYRPRGSSIEEVKECARVARRAGAQLALNLLTFPGVSDTPSEIDLTATQVEDLRVDQVQLRNLNVDPRWLLQRIPDQEPGVGLEHLRSRLRQQLPALRLG
ncbi:MAG: radical SAM protein, partial [Streptosporangiaceae bacterium]